MKYRIVTNGINYRVQWLGKILILRRPKWYWLQGYPDLGWMIEIFGIISMVLALSLRFV